QGLFLRGVLNSLVLVLRYLCLRLPVPKLRVINLPRLYLQSTQRVHGLPKRRALHNTRVSDNAPPEIGDFVPIIPSLGADSYLAAYDCSQRNDSAHGWKVRGALRALGNVLNPLSQRRWQQIEFKWLDSW